MSASNSSSAMRISIIIPALNEESGLGQVIRAVQQALAGQPISYEIIVVDDGSTDNTAAVGRKHGARVLRHLRNRGYGAALKTGIKAAAQEYIVITDADCTYHPSAISPMLEQLKTSDMVIGLRCLDGRIRYQPRSLARKILRHLAEFITGEEIPDLNSGLRAFRNRFVRQYLGILPDGFSFTTTLTVAALCDGYKLDYVPTPYGQRCGTSKLVPLDFLNFVTLVLKLSVLFRPLRLFVPIAGICFLFGAAKLAFDIAMVFSQPSGTTFLTLTHPVVSATALMLLLSGLQLLLVGMVSEAIARKIALHHPQSYESCCGEDTVKMAEPPEGVSVPESDSDTSAVPKSNS